MSFTPTAEHDELRAVLRSFFESRCDEAALRAAVETSDGHDPAVWRQLADQIGAPGLAVPEEFGGVGYGLRELGIVFEEAGRVLYPGPLLSTFLAGDLLTGVLSEPGVQDAGADTLPPEATAAAAAVLEQLAAGATQATVAWIDESGRGPARVTISEDGPGAVRLDGTASFVIEAQLADQVLVVIPDPAGAASDTTGGSVVVLAEIGEGVEVTPMTSLDLTRRLCTLTFRAAPARPLSRGPRAVATWQRTLMRARALVAAEQAGAAARVVAMAVEYAKLRQQFGRPIGSFQAIKHKCADMFLSAESARASAAYALWVADENPAELEMAAAESKSYCSEALTSVATENIQVHGGIGFTWEHPAHLYYRRAKSSELLLGSPRELREHLAGLIGLSA